MSLPEVWLRGPLPHIPPLLQPVAHALLQAVEETDTLMTSFPTELLWQQPAGLASPAFHLQHMAGVLDRLTTYARGEALTEAQLTYLRSEGVYTNTASTTLLLAVFRQEVEKVIIQLEAEDESALTEYRAVGRGQLPSTALGLYVHAAEHTMRHLGQLLVTVKVLMERRSA